MGKGVDAGKLTAFRQIAARLAAGMDPAAEPADPMVGGLSVGSWFQVFWDTHEQNGVGGLVRVEWPEGGGYEAQANATVAALDAVRDEVMKAAEKERNRIG